MALHIFSFLLLLLLLTTFCFTALSDSNPTHHHHHHHSPNRAFIEAQCRDTLYRKLCVKCLSNYVNITNQSPQQLAQTVLRVSLARASYARSYVTKVVAQLKQNNTQKFPALTDCLDQINDSVGQLAQSVKELRRINQDGQGDFLRHTSNVRTWLSAALTDATTCLDGFSSDAVGEKVKATIKAKILNVIQTTSNALSFFNRFAARNRGTTSP